MISSFSHEKKMNLLNNNHEKIFTPVSSEQQAHSYLSFLSLHSQQHYLRIKWIAKFLLLKKRNSLSLSSSLVFLRRKKLWDETESIMNYFNSFPLLFHYAQKYDDDNIKMEMENTHSREICRHSTAELSAKKL